MSHHIHSEPLSTLGDTVEKFIISFPQACDLKDPKLKKYLRGNWPYAEKLGVVPEDINGLQFYDVLSHAGWNLSNDVNMKVLQAVNQLDYQAYSRKEVIRSEKNIFATHEGTLLVEDYVKVPVFGQSKNVVAILGYSQDLTHQCDLFSLFRLYQCHYTEQKAIQYFLRYLKIEHHFNQLPNYREMMSFLAMFFDSSHKHIAKLLGIKLKTVDSHIQNLKMKLKETPLGDIIRFIRARSRSIHA